MSFLAPDMTYCPVCLNENFVPFFQMNDVPTQDGIDFYNTQDIIYCKADGSYTLMILTNNQHTLVCKNLLDFENLLIDSGFCRVHHSYLVNLKHVQKYVKGDGGYVILTDNHHVDISRRKKDEFLALLDRP